MNKIKDILIKTVLPMTIGASVFVGYFFIDDRLLTTKKDIELCEVFYLSNTDYFVGQLILTMLGTTFQLTVGAKLSRILKDLKFIGKVINVSSFALFTTIILFIKGLFSRASIELNLDIDILGTTFLYGLTLGAIFVTTMSVFDKLIKSKHP